jgi:hypothetical protein
VPITAENTTAPITFARKNLDGTFVLLLRLMGSGVCTGAGAFEMVEAICSIVTFCIAAVRG